MNIKKANVLILTLSIFSFKNLVCEDTIEQIATFAKGVGAAVVSVGACDGLMESLHGKSWSDSIVKNSTKTITDVDLLDVNWYGHFLKALSYAYSISKIAPYSRRCLNLRQDVLLDGPMRDINRNRGKATLNTITSALMSTACIYHIFKEISKETIAKENSHLIAFNFSKAVALAYALYKFAPDAYAHMRVSLAI